jgi:hypothetical protein
MITYPYAGAGINGTYDSMETFGQLLIEDDGQSLKVQRFFQGQAQGNKVNVIPDYDYFPFAFDDGGVHYIDGVL